MHHFLKLIVALSLLAVSMFGVSTKAIGAESAAENPQASAAGASHYVNLYNYTTGTKDRVNPSSLTQAQAKQYLPPISGVEELFDAHIKAGKSVPEAIAMTYAGIAQALNPEQPNKE